MAVKFKWLGYDKAWMDARVASMLAAIVYPEARGKPKLYTSVKDDSPDEADAKKKRMAEYRKTREREYREHLARQDAVGVFGPDGPTQIVCEKGKIVDVSEKHPGLAKLIKLAEVDGAGGWSYDGTWVLDESGAAVPKKHPVQSLVDEKTPKK